MYYLFLLISFLCLSTETIFSMENSFGMLRINNPEKPYKNKSKILESSQYIPITCNGEQEIFFLENKEIIFLSQKIIDNSQTLKNMIHDNVNLFDTLPFTKKDMQYVECIIDNALAKIPTPLLEKYVKIADHLQLTLPCMRAVADVYLSKYPKSAQKFQKKAKRLCSLNGLAEDELQNCIVPSGNSSAIMLNNKHLHSLDDINLLYQLLNNNAHVTEISLAHNKISNIDLRKLKTLLNTYPQITKIDIKDNLITRINLYKNSITHLFQDANNAYKLMAESKKIRVLFFLACHYLVAYGIFIAGEKEHPHQEIVKLCGRLSDPFAYDKITGKASAMTMLSIISLLSAGLTSLFVQSGQSLNYTYSKIRI